MSYNNTLTAKERQDVANEFCETILDYHHDSLKTQKESDIVNMPGCWYETAELLSLYANGWL